MTIKSEVVKPAERAEHTYPKLMQARDTGCIVLFYKYKEGSCLHPGTTGNRVGEYSCSWAMNHFDDFHGTITLTQD